MFANFAIEAAFALFGGRASGHESDDAHLAGGPNAGRQTARGHPPAFLVVGGDIGDAARSVDGRIEDGDGDAERGRVLHHAHQSTAVDGRESDASEAAVHHGFDDLNLTAGVHFEGRSVPFDFCRAFGGGLDGPGAHGLPENMVRALGHHADNFFLRGAAGHERGQQNWHAEQAHRSTDGIAPGGA